MAQHYAIGSVEEARAYLDGLKNGIDGLLKNAFADEGDKRQDNKDEKKDQS